MLDSISHWKTARSVAAVALLTLMGLDSLVQGASPCNKVTIRGHVVGGQLFSASFGRELLFRLSPHSAPGRGWYIEVVSRSSPAEDLVTFATPPFHFENDRYLDTSYGNTAADAVAHNPRQFNFTLEPSDNARMRAVVERLLESQSDGATKDAEAALKAIRTGRGLFRILKSRVVQPDTLNEFGVIESLEFRVELCVPK